MKKFLQPLLYMLLFFTPICCPLYLGMRLFGIEPFAPAFCLNRYPSEARIVEALRYGPGDGETGIGDDGLTYRMERLDCPHWVAVSTPKMSMYLYVEANGVVLSEGELYIGLIDSSRPIIFRYTPSRPISPKVREQYPALQAFLKQYVQ